MEKESMPKEKIVSCPMDCFDLCRFKVTVENNQVTAIKGDENHPLTAGVICAKGKALVQRHAHPDRLKTPMLRKGRGFEPISYDQAFDLIIDRLNRLKKEWGPKALLNYTSDGYGGMKSRIQSIFFNTWGGDSRFSGSLCWSAGIKAQEYDFGRAKGHRPEDVLNSGLVILWGRNPRVTNLHLHMLLKKARKKGTQVVVIDPVKTATARAFDRHIAINPGTDGALALGMMHVVVCENQAHDRAFIQNHVIGFNRLMPRIQAMTVEKAAAITGVSTHTIRQLALDYVQAGSAAVFIGYGMQRYTNGGASVRCINALGAVCGHIGKKGGGVNYAAKSIAPYLSGPEKHSLKGKGELRTFPAPFLGSFLQTAQDPPVKMAFISGGNPLVQTPDISRAIEGVKQLDFVVVFDQFLTDTAAAAHLVLPAATVFEQEDIFTTSMYCPVANFSEKAVEPPAGLMPEFEFYMALARRMDLDLGFSSSRDYLDQCAGPFLEKLGFQTELGIDSDGLENSGLLNPYLSIASDEIAWQDFKFLTPSKKIEIFSESAQRDGLDPLPGFVPPKAAGDAYPLRLLTCHSETSMHSQGFMDHEDRARVKLHTATAEQMGLEKVKWVNVKAEAGQITAQLVLDDHIHKNTAFMTQGYWHKSGAVNFLTSELVSDMGDQAAFYESFCRIEPA